jgi:hypothetical protein
MKRLTRIFWFISILVIVVLVAAFHYSSGKMTDTGQVVSIPVIVHLIIDDKKSKCWEVGANDDKNLSTDLIRKELNDLHNDLLLRNRDTSEVLEIYKPIIANPHINFSLDTTYQTNATAGIIRVNNPDNLSWTTISPVINPEKYFNVYIVNNSHSFTSTNHVWGNPSNDAVFLYYCWVGRHYRLLTHETGHWLGLLHLWGTGNGKGNRQSCEVGDGIDDTHPQKNATDGSCDRWPPQVPNQSCDRTLCNYNNYMDYSGQRRMFTKGQVKKIRQNLFHYRTAMAANSAPGAK